MRLKGVLGLVALGLTITSWAGEPIAPPPDCEPPLQVAATPHEAILTSAEAMASSEGWECRANGVCYTPAALIPSYPWTVWRSWRGPGRVADYVDATVSFSNSSPIGVFGVGLWWRSLDGGEGGCWFPVTLVAGTVALSDTGCGTFLDTKPPDAIYGVEVRARLDALPDWTYTHTVVITYLAE